MSSIDAPTTLPTANARRGPLDRLFGIVLEPHRAFPALVDDEDTHPVEPFVLYALVTLTLHAAETYRLLSLASDAPFIVAKRLLDVVVKAGRTDLAVVVGAALIVGAIGRLRGHSFLQAAMATTYLLVPLTILKALGGVLGLAGVDLWWLPHDAVDSYAIVVNGKVEMGRFAVKCLVSYGSGLATLVHWLVRAGTPAATTATRVATPPRAVVARSGAAIFVGLAGMLLLGSAADIAKRKDQLRPHLSGDTFPSIPLRRLNTGGRLDVLELLKPADAKVMVVDFWASWCGPCRRSMPELSTFAAAYKDKGVVVVGVNREPRDRAAARAAWKEMQPIFDSVVDDQGLGERLGLTSLPSSYIVDSTGRIRHLHLGYTSIETVQAEVDAILADGP